ncbi:MAG: hypothetical protein NWE80_03460 [Candidatus Bathyarchaeota archaeon]|nr:hypothetical protein [Candidatus Bathyarchaeota archaeon]
MVSATYDHIVAILIVGAIFVGTVVTLPALNYANLGTVDQQQLRNTALNVFDSMLLSAGSHSNWGSVETVFDQDAVEKFGLAYSAPFSKYVLDVDKVQRIDQSNPTGFIEYNRAHELLNLEDYGFQFSILRPFVVNSSLNITRNEVHYHVAVTRTEDGTPIPNAEVKVTTILSVMGGSKFDIVRCDPVTNFTNALGICEGIQTANVSGGITHAISIMTITVSGISTTVVARTNDPLSELIRINTSGDDIILSLPEEIIGNNTRSERRIVQIDVYDSEALFPLFEMGDLNPPDIKFSAGTGYEHWIMNYPGLKFMDPTALIFWVELTLKGHGRVLVLLAGSLDFMAEQKILSLGPDPENKNPIVIMRRLVVISDMTYVSQIAFWRDGM